MRLPGQVSESRLYSHQATVIFHEVAIQTICEPARILSRQDPQTRDFLVELLTGSVAVKQCKEFLLSKNYCMSLYKTMSYRLRQNNRHREEFLLSSSKIIQGSLRSKNLLISRMESAMRDDSLCQ
jgi:hypothetical protein